MRVRVSRGLKEQIDHKVVEGRKVLISVREFGKKKNLSMKVKMNISDCV